MHRSEMQCLQQNDLLAGLSPASLAPLAAAFELVPMHLGDVLYEPGAPLRHAYFPTTAVVSLHLVTAEGATAETACVGHDGMVGISLFMGGDTTPSSAVVRTGGHGYRLERRVLKQAFDRGGPLRRSLLRYTQSLMTRITQAAACYRRHSVEQQLSSWMMATLDRMPVGELVVTQELLASVLGLRRENVAQAAGTLQAGGYIRYRRGHISVVDPDGLRAVACECYHVVKAEQQRLSAVSVFDGMPAAAG